MSYLKEIWVCEACGFQDELGNLPDTRHVVNWCPKCKERGQFGKMITQRQYEEKKRLEELRKQIYCRECEHMGPVESFPFDAPEEEEWRERRCPHCGSDNGINASLVRFCMKCGKVAAAEGDQYCDYCRSEEDEAVGAEGRASYYLDHPD